MISRILFMLPGLAMAALLTVDLSPKAAADPEIVGNWLFSFSPRGGTDQVFAIFKVEFKDGKVTAKVLAAEQQFEGLSVSKVELTGKTLTFATSLGVNFEGTVSADGKMVVGNISSDVKSFRAKLARTDKTELTANDRVIITPPPAPAAETQKLTAAATQARMKAQLEKDAEKKKDLLEKEAAAVNEAEAKTPNLLREVVAKHADTPFALDAATDLLRGGPKTKVTTDEAAKLLDFIEKRSAEFGPQFTRFQMMVAVEAVVGQKELAGVAESAAGKLAKTPGAQAEFVSPPLKAQKDALVALGKTQEAKSVASELAKLEERLDSEYLARVPPFKPTPFAGRKAKSANRVAVIELFTGTECSPCVAADVAFDALQKAYKPTELVLIQYHMHIPGPDPLTSPTSVGRWDYYREQFPNEIGGTPTTLFNGKPQAGGGGSMAGAEAKYNQYTAIIDPLLEQSTAVKVAGEVTRAGDKLAIAVEVTGCTGDDMKLRLLVCEETVKYIGVNQIRFHYQVIRAMPDGVEGVAIKDKTFKHTAAADLGEVRKNLTKYLDEYARIRPFPKPERPMDLTALRVIALVQNDKTREIVQAAQFDVTSKPARGQ